MLGSHIVSRLVESGHSVRIIQRVNSDLTLLGPYAGSIEHFIGDVTDTQSLSEAMEGVSHVFHCAARIGFGGRTEQARLYLANVTGTANVINAALHCGVERILHVSSIAALGRGPDDAIEIDETAEWVESPFNSPYGRSKRFAEHEIQRGIVEGLDAVIVNPSLIFGMARPGENTRQIIEKVRDGRFPAVPSGGTNVVDVRDVAEGAIKAIQEGRTGERYILGGENLPWRRILEITAHAFGVRPPSRRLPYYPALAFGLASEAFATITNRPVTVSRASVRSSMRFHRYSNAKAKTELDLTFRPFEETARFLAAALSRKD
jgi:dihydroflavonol-4-reductase